MCLFFCFFKQKTAYEMRISDWSSDVCSSDLKEIVEDPYLLSELFVGDAPEDIIPWSTIDRGVFPSPELGGDVLCDMLIDDPRRLRSLCVEQLRREPNQTFRDRKSTRLNSSH